MFADEGDELLIGQTEYIVLNKYTEDGKEYLFVASLDNLEENIADNFDSDALKLLLLSQDDINTDEANQEIISSNYDNFADSYISEDSFEKDYDYNTDTNTTTTYYEYEDYSNDYAAKTSQFFTVEKQPNFIERILEVMFLK